MRELYLIGTIHMDLHGPERLEKIFHFLNPDIVAIEFNNDSVDTVEGNEDTMACPEMLDSIVTAFGEIFPGARPETVREVLKKSHFEYYTSRDFCNSRGLTFYCADNGGVKELVEEYMNPESHLHESFAEKLRMNLAELKNKVTALYENGNNCLSSDMLDDVLARDEFTESILRQLDGRVVYVGGMVHIYGKYPENHNLYERLKNLNPTRMRLIDADKL